ncbi:hypothetical protein GGP80_003328 [Salinibacter ruber]|jgi:hypothetical protein|uniref:DUF6009 family protein n=1 Tax=Salinibacter ruber TaxID=146919 RepID=UPI00245028BE|nr:hypothetical protein [Salinibacter ruber]MCS4181955.1 hypothetical protein [Salinibacter ruber]
MISDKRLQKEAEIVWEVPIEDLDYVRETITLAGTRTRGVPWNGEGKRVGYAVLEEDASSRSPGRFNRRVFFLKSYDRPDGDGTYATGCPSEAVDPRTVEAGQGGKKTPRVRAEE